MEPIIETKNLTRFFKVGNQVIYALRDVSVTIPQKSLVILKGPSGSGKTTLINLLGALDKPDNGQIIYKDKDITRLREKDRDNLRRFQMGFVFQSVALISLMTAYENVELALKIAAYDPLKSNERVDYCLDLVGLLKRKNHKPFEMSGGEQQRVAIARAIAHEPDVVFADEPTAELDTHLGLQVVKLFKVLIAKQGISIIMTTHDPNMMEIGDYVLSLEDGKIIS